MGGCCWIMEGRIYFVLWAQIFWVHILQLIHIKKKKKKNQTETQYKSSNTSPEIPTSENWSYYKEARKINKITNQEEKSIHFQVWQVIGEGDHFPLEEMSLDIIKECCQTLV